MGNGNNYKKNIKRKKGMKIKEDKKYGKEERELGKKETETERKIEIKEMGEKKRGDKRDGKKER